MGFVAALIGCGEPYDVYGGGEISIEFGPYDEYGYEGTVVVEGARRSQLLEEPELREGFVSALTVYQDGSRFVCAYGTGTGDTVIHSAAPGTPLELLAYADWISPSELPSGGVGAFGIAPEGASIEMATLVPPAPLPGSVLGTWEDMETDFEMQGVVGTLSGTMNFVSVPPPPPWDTTTPATWTQEVTVTYSFSERVHRVVRPFGFWVGSGFDIGLGGRAAPTDAPAR